MTTDNEMSTPKSNPNEAALRRLVAMGERGRLMRADNRPCRSVEFNGNSWKGTVQGEGNAVWRPRITVFGGQRSFGCTCPDHQKQRGSQGPCKHVLSLAKAGLEELDLLSMFDEMF